MNKRRILLLVAVVAVLIAHGLGARGAIYTGGAGDSYAMDEMSQDKLLKLRGMVVIIR